MIKCPQCGHDNDDSNSFCENCRRSLVVVKPSDPSLQTIGELQTFGGDPTIRRDQVVDNADFELKPGTVFADRYTIESLIGTGGMGMVYRAKDKIGDRDVALKLIRPDRLGGEAAVKRLLAEGILTQDIRHKNVVAVYHVGEVDSRPFISMEFVDGISLREWHRKHVNARTDVPMRVAARIIAEILDGLQSAHEMNVVHRDLKPENIMLTAEPTDKAAPLKILDFGIARAGGKAAESSTGTGIGTPRYMAPEQITNPESAGPSADIYSLSTIFYELLVDVLPQGGWQPPSAGRPDVPPAIDALIQSGLQNRPASRPQSAKEYREKLVAAVSGTVIQHDNKRDTNIGGNTQAPASKPNWLLIGGGAVGAVVLLGIIVAVVNPGPDDDGYKTTDTSEISTVKSTDDRMTLRQNGLNYAQLSGTWNDGYGGHADVTVTPDGRFSGPGENAQGAELFLTGSFNGLAGTYSVSGGGTTLPGQIAWDGRDCHLNFQTNWPNGTPALQGQFHVDHMPGQPCPPR